MVRNLPKQIPFPSKDEILTFINKQPGKVGAREIARAFHLKNDRRVELKRVLRELADAGQVESRRKKLHQAGALPRACLKAFRAPSASPDQASASPRYQP